MPLPDLITYDAGRTLQFAQQGQHQRTLADLGRQAAAGNYAGAASAAFAGGETELGLKLKQMSDAEKQQLVDRAASWAYSADTPEKWNAGRQYWLDQGYDPGDFQQRMRTISAALSAKDQMTFDLERQKLKVAGNENVGLTPIYGTDANGNVVPMLPSRTGKAVTLEPPSGVSFAGKPVAVETTDGTIFMDPITRQPMRDPNTGQPVFIPKDPAAAAARGQLPGAIADAETTVKQIDDLVKSPGLGGITGGPFGLALNQYKPTWQMNPQEVDAFTRLSQLQGKGFLEARQLLKGGGQITDYEGSKAENAMSRMSRALSKEDFIAALNDFKDAVQSGVAKLKAQAARVPTAPAIGSAPAAPAAPAAAAPPVAAPAPTATAPAATTTPSDGIPVGGTPIPPGGFPDAGFPPKSWIDAGGTPQTWKYVPPEQRSLFP